MAMLTVADTDNSGVGSAQSRYGSDRPSASGAHADFTATPAPSYPYTSPQNFAQTAYTGQQYSMPHQSSAPQTAHRAPPAFPQTASHQSPSANARTFGHTGGRADFTGSASTRAPGQMRGRPTPNTPNFQQSYGVGCAQAPPSTGYVPTFNVQHTSAAVPPTSDPSRGFQQPAGFTYQWAKPPRQGTQSGATAQTRSGAGQPPSPQTQSYQTFTAPSQGASYRVNTAQGGAGPNRSERNPGFVGGYAQVRPTRFSA